MNRHNSMGRWKATFSTSTPQKKLQNVARYDNKNHKKILCNNIISDNECPYGTKCLYAHSMEEQNVDDLRKKAYDMILKDDDLSSIDLKSNYELYETLLELTHVCENCVKHRCTGGYNCKYGVYDEQYQLCKTDIVFGDCDGNCGNIHLTSKGLKCYNKHRKSIITEMSELNYYDDTEDDNDTWQIPKSNIPNTSLDFLRIVSSSNTDNEFISFAMRPTTKNDDDCNVSIFS
jgi:hypothetical protein